MAVDYTPSFDPADVDSDYGSTGGDITVPTFTANMKPFRFWCQRALPLVYDDSLSYYEVLCKVVDQMNGFLTDLQTATGSIGEYAQQFVVNQQFLNQMAEKLGQDVDTLETYINDRMDDFTSAYEQLQSYVNNYFDNLDVQQEINNKLDAMADDGTFNTLFNPVITAWMTEKTAQIDSAIANQDAIQAQQNGRISVLEGRMDGFASLPPGSTSGNAELLDIRTNFLGETYPTAGDAVRASDMIASGFRTIAFQNKASWAGNQSDTKYDTASIDISNLKGSKFICIYNLLIDTAQSSQPIIFVGNTVEPDENAIDVTNNTNYHPLFTLLKEYDASPLPDSSSYRYSVAFDIPSDIEYNRLYIVYAPLYEESQSENYDSPNFIAYYTMWSKTPVDPTLSVTGDAADAKATGDALSELNERLSFYNFGHCTSRIDWDTVNKTITIGRGFFVYAGGYKAIAEAIVLSYTNFNLLTVLAYNGTTFEFRTFQDLVAGDAVALFYVDKMYTPFEYSNIYVNNTLISPENLFNDFGSFVTAINLRIDTLKNEIDTIFATVNTLVDEETIYNVNITQKSNASNDNIWFPKELTIPSDTLIKYIDVYVDSGTERTFTISLWNSNTGEKYYNEEYTIIPTLESGSYYVRVPINEITIAPTKVGFYSESAFVTVAHDDQHNLLYVAPSATSISDASTLARYAINATIKVVRKEESPILSKEIHVGPGLEYTEIQDAIESVSGNYATIIVHPKETPYNRFSLMRSLGGTYPWSGLANVKHISIIGVDKSKCIIQSNTGNYDTPPAEIATNGIIKNLTFIATHSASDGTETTGSYAVHVDNRPRDENGMKLIFENCDFISYQTAAVGLGLYRNQDISFIGCNFKSITDITWKPNENYNPTYMCALGAYFMHTTMGYAGGNMFIRFRNCFLYHSGGDYAMRIADADETQTALLEAIGNTLWAADTQTTGYYTTNKPIMQQPYNHGNNDSLLNA